MSPNDEVCESHCPTPHIPSSSPPRVPPLGQSPPLALSAAYPPLIAAATPPSSCCTVGLSSPPSFYDRRWPLPPPPPTVSTPNSHSTCVTAPRATSRCPLLHRVVPPTHLSAAARPTHGWGRSGLMCGGSAPARSVTE
jgi:hypothetical protein